MSGDNYFVSSHNQAGGITAGQVVVGAVPRKLDGEAKRMLLSNLPRDQVVEVSASLGDAEAYHFAAEMKDFLQTNGYRVEGINQCVWMPPVSGVHIIVGETPRKIQVGSR